MFGCVVQNYHGFAKFELDGTMPSVVSPTLSGSKLLVNGMVGGASG